MADRLDNLIQRVQSVDANVDHLSDQILAVEEHVLGVEGRVRIVEERVLVVEGKVNHLTENVGRLSASSMISSPPGDKILSARKKSTRA